MSLTDDQTRPFFKGETREFRATFTSKDQVTTSNPDGRVNLDGATVYYTWKFFPGDPNPAQLALLTGTGIVHLAQTGATLGQADITVVPTDTSSLDAREYHRDVWAVLPGDERKIALTPDIVELRETVLLLP